MRDLVVEEAASVGGGSDDRGQCGVRFRAPLGSAERCDGELLVAGADRDSHQVRLVGYVGGEEEEGRLALLVAALAKPTNSGLRVAPSHLLERKEPACVATEPRRPVAGHRPRQRCHVLQLSLVTTMDSDAAEGDDADDLKQPGEPIVFLSGQVAIEHRSRIVESSELKKSP